MYDLSSDEASLYSALKAASEEQFQYILANESSLAMYVQHLCHAGNKQISWTGQDAQHRPKLAPIQRVTAQKRLKFGKVVGRDNPADFYTKHFDLDTIHRHSLHMSPALEGGSAATAQELQVMTTMAGIDTNNATDDSN